jgi:membrane protein
MAKFGNRMDIWRRAHFSGVLSDIGNFVAYGIRRFVRDRMTQAAGALTYTTLLALVPLLAIAFSIFSAFPAFDAIQDKIQDMIFNNLVPEVGQDVRGYLTSFTANASQLTAVGVVALALSAVLLLSTIESTLNTIWRVERQRPILTRLLMFWAVLTLGPMLLGASFSLTSDVFTTAERWAGEASAYVPTTGGNILQSLESPIAIVLQSLAFTTLFFAVPARSVRIRDAAIGGVISGVAFELLKSGFKAYLTAFPTYQTIYGALAVFPIFLIWLYLCWTVIILGAVFAASFPEWWRSREPEVDINLTPARRLQAAVALLAVLGGKAQTGGAVTQDDLAAAIPLEARDGIVETLRAKGYLVTTDDDSYSLSRDLHAVTVAELAHDLGLTLGLSAEDREHDDLGVVEERSLETVTGFLSGMLETLHASEKELLGRPVAEVIFSRAHPSEEHHSETSKHSKRANA